MLELLRDSHLTLQANIDAEHGRIDGILSLSTEELNTFNEIATAFQNADSNLTTLINTLTTDFTALKDCVDLLVQNSA